MKILTIALFTLCPFIVSSEALPQWRVDFNSFPKGEQQSVDYINRFKGTEPVFEEANLLADDRKKVLVLGAINAKGYYVLGRETSLGGLLQFVTFDPQASKSKLIVVNPQKRYRYEISSKNLIGEEDVVGLANLIHLEEGDVIYIPKVMK
jgi:hypothetical protein